MWAACNCDKLIQFVMQKLHDIISWYFGPFLSAEVSRNHHLHNKFYHFLFAGCVCALCDSFFVMSWRLSFRLNLKLAKNWNACDKCLKWLALCLGENIFSEFVTQYQPGQLIIERFISSRTLRFLHCTTVIPSLL